MPNVVLPLDIQCAACAARTVKLELDIPDPIVPPLAEISATMRCAACGKSQIFGTVAATVDAEPDVVDATATEEP